MPQPADLANVCAHCGGEIADDGFAVKMAEGGESEAEELPGAPDEPEREPSGFLAALRMRRPSSTTPAPKEGE